jgi:hypothetical protein
MIMVLPTWSTRWAKYIAARIVLTHVAPETATSAFLPMEICMPAIASWAIQRPRWEMSSTVSIHRCKRTG